MAIPTIYLTPDAEACLKLYEPVTYGINIPPAVAKELLEAGFVRWVPGPAWAGLIYEITDAGAIYLDEELAPHRAA